MRGHQQGHAAEAQETNREYTALAESYHVGEVVEWHSDRVRLGTVTEILPKRGRVRIRVTTAEGPIDVPVLASHVRRPG